MRGTDKSAIQSIRPGMIRTLQRLAELPTLFFAQARSAMSTNIIKRSQAPGLVAQSDDALARHVLHEIFAGLADLVLVPHAKPLPGKDPLLFLRKNLGGDKKTSLKCP